MNIDSTHQSNPVACEPLESDPGEATEVHPYARHVNPDLAELLAKLRLDKRYVRGEGCLLFDDAGRAIPRLYRRVWGAAVWL